MVQSDIQYPAGMSCVVCRLQSVEWCDGGEPLLILLLLLPDILTRTAVYSLPVRRTYRIMVL